MDMLNAVFKAGALISSIERFLVALLVLIIRPKQFPTGVALPLPFSQELDGRWLQRHADEFEERADRIMAQAHRPIPTAAAFAPWEHPSPGSGRKPA